MAAPARSMDSTNKLGKNFGRHAFGDKGLKEIALLNIVEVLHADTALEALTDFARVIFEALEVFDLAGVDDFATPDNLDLVLAADRTIDHHTTGNRANLADPEDLANFGPAVEHLTVDRLEQTRHRLLHLFDEVVDDRVDPDVDLLLIGGRRRVAFGLDVEADDQSLRRRGEQDVRFVDRTDTGRQNADLDLVGRELLQHVGEHFRGTAHVRFENDEQFLGFAFLHGRA